MKDKRNLYKPLATKPEGKRLLGKITAAGKLHINGSQRSNHELYITI
jgi:hypothetical protein